MKVLLNAHRALLLEQLVQLALLAGQLDGKLLAPGQKLLRVLQPTGHRESEFIGLLSRPVTFSLCLG